MPTVSKKHFFYHLKSYEMILKYNFKVRVHTTGALWNLSSHQAIKQSLLDQVLTDCVEKVLLPYAEALRANKITKVCS